MSMIHITKRQEGNYLVVDNTAVESGFGSPTTVQSEDELRSSLTTKRVKEEAISRCLAQLKKTGDSSIVL